MAHAHHDIPLRSRSLWRSACTPRRWLPLVVVALITAVDVLHAAELPAPSSTLSAAAQRPYWERGETLTAPPRCALDRSLAGAGSTIIVLVPVGDVPETLLGAIGYVLQRELSLPACISSTSVPLPPPTRMGDRPVGEQWHADELVKAFARLAPARADTPAVFVLVTPVDIYKGDVHFLFSQSYPWGGAVVSFARFGDPRQEEATVAHRTAKSALGALVKGFDLPPSSDPNCVTSYTRSLPEFDAKGNRPSPETMERFRAALQRRDNAWAARASGTPSAE
ncbi:MAG: hypothetical protein SF182_13270 [Deltaproteobacteria bacterium]|nr:hypothetical protein [Deltaproteobacteria bacterium]